MICVFFGHHDAPPEIQVKLTEVLTELIISHDVTVFYVGNQGNFDFLVRKALEKIKPFYSFECAVVLAYLPVERRTDNFIGFETIFPDGLEDVPPRFAISRRNDWMIKKADYVVTYVKHSFGNAAKCKEKAERQGKYIIELAQ